MADHLTGPNQPSGTNIVATKDGQRLKVEAKAATSSILSWRERRAARTVPCGSGPAIGPFMAGLPRGSRFMAAGTVAGGPERMITDQRRPGVRHGEHKCTSNR